MPRTAVIFWGETDLTFQSVEEPGLYSGADWISNIYERKNSKAKRGQQIPPFPCGQFFQVHGNKLKLHPVRHLGQASVLRITHRVFFFGIRKDTFNGLFPLLVKILVKRIVPRIDFNQINTLIDEAEGISAVRKRFYKVMLQQRYEKILMYAYRQL